MAEARHAEIALTYNDKDITVELAPFLKSFTFTDNSGDKADEISVTLEDRAGRWRDSWYPDKGATLTARITTRNWNANGRVENLPCGTFEIDQIECSGGGNQGTQVTIKAVSTLISKPMVQEQKTRAWENILLSAIAADIANANDLALFWDSSDDPLLVRRDQIEQSDLSYLKELCADYGIAVKVTDTQLVCYREEDYEAKNSVATIAEGDAHLKSFKFTSKSQGKFKSAKMSYHAPAKGQTYVVEVDADGIETGRTLAINEHADSEADAEKIARNKLRNANKREVTASFTLMGDLRFVGGQNITVEGFGKFDGKYVIERAKHDVTGSGYTTTLELRSPNAAAKTKVKGKSKKSSPSENYYTGDDYYQNPP